MASKQRPATDQREFRQNPFENLSQALGLGPDDSPTQPVQPAPAPKNRGRVEIRRMKAGRGGKTVTVVSAFVGISLAEKEKLARQMQKACGAGGTVKDGQIEIQGDKREAVALILKEAGFRPVLAGG